MGSSPSPEAAEAARKESEIGAAAGTDMYKFAKAKNLAAEQGSTATLTPDGYLRPTQQGKKVLLSIDEMERLKGTALRLLAFEMLLTRQPELRGHLTPVVAVDA